MSGFETASQEEWVQVQEMYPSRVTFDQRREQTINRDAKTKGKAS